MKLQQLTEPELEFAHGGRHVDIRFGLMTHGPLDRPDPGEPRRIKLGVVGTPESVQGVLKWFDRCRTEIPAKGSRYANLFPRFPGFRPDAAFHAEIVCDDRMQRKIPPHNFTLLAAQTDYCQMLEVAAALFVTEAQYLVQETEAEVIVCAVPLELVRLIDREDESSEGTSSGTDTDRWQFHDVLKARGMVVGKPFQMIRPSTYGLVKVSKPKGTRRKRSGRGTQDEATRAWNIFTALYYKAKGVPWRLERQVSELTACHVGVSFFQTLVQFQADSCVRGSRCSQP